MTCPSCGQPFDDFDQHKCPPELNERQLDALVEHGIALGVIVLVIDRGDVEEVFGLLDDNEWESIRRPQVTDMVIRQLLPLEELRSARYLDDTFEQRSD